MENTLNSRLIIKELAKKLQDNFKNDVLKGLSLPKGQKNIPYFYLYDHEGSEIFEEITDIKEYYLTQCELSILKKESKNIAKLFNPKSKLIELGSGSSSKTRTLIEAFIEVHGECNYVPIDISSSMLIQTSQELINDYPQLNIIAVHGTYKDALDWIHEEFKMNSKLISFLGSSIGNMNPGERDSFLELIRKSVQKYDKLLIGIDLKKSLEILYPAYDDPKKVTKRFTLNLLTRINRELNANFDVSKFDHYIQWVDGDSICGVGRIEIYILSLANQKAIIDGVEVSFEEKEKIFIEYTHKYSKIQIDYVANKADFKVETQWLDEQKKFSLSLFSPSDSPQVNLIKNSLTKGWDLSDKILFKIVKSEAYLKNPIKLRHPFIFYMGHLTAFEKNQIFSYILNHESDTKEFDVLFERGMDPIVDDPTKCHWHSADANRSKWPTVEEIIEYKEKTRKLIIENILKVLECKSHMMAHKGKVFHMVKEHTEMHCETLAYMIQVLDSNLKNQLNEIKLNLNIIEPPIEFKNKKIITIPAGKTVLGVDYHEIDWGWDNEFPAIEKFVPEFEIDEIPVTNQEYINFIESGEYENPANWLPSNYDWKEKNGLKHPQFLLRIDGKWHVKTMVQDVPIEYAKNWPVYCSQAEASAYAHWIGKRLPTESEYLRAAYGSPKDETRKYPWGDEEPIAGVHGNFDFNRWGPIEVGSYPKGKSAWGVYELIGNGWEWTSSLFNGFEGFEKTIPQYQTYSADFFDDCHFVMLGASWATTTDLIRKSLRNWFQNHYEYMFSKFRCVREH